MATYAAKTGTQNFTDTWALVDATSANITEGGQTTSTNTTTSYVASSAFTPGAITIDGIAVFIRKTALQGNRSVINQNYGTFSVRLAQAGTTVTNTELTVNVTDLAPMCYQNNNDQFGEFGEIIDKIGGGWVFFKFASNVTLLAATAYTLDVKSSVAGNVAVGYASTTSNWMRYLRTTTTGTPAAADRLFICGEISGSSTWSTNTVNHDLTSSATTYSRVDIGAYGAWNWNTAASTNYYFKTNGDIRLGTLGQLQIGTSGTPLPSTSTATIEFVSTGGGALTLYCARKSTLTMSGPTKKHLGYLVSTIAANVSTATVSDNKVTTVDPGWKNGDRVIFAPMSTDATPSNHYQKYDTVLLNADSSSGVITWSSATDSTNASKATTYHPHNVYQPWVANLTRNIVIRGATAANTFAFTVNTDQINMVGVEMYFVDGLHIRNSDGLTQGLVKNCVVREGRSRTVDTTGAGTGIILRGGKNFIVEDCVVSRGNGIAITASITNNPVPPMETTITVKGCVIIGNNLSNYGSIQDFSDAFIKYENCVVTASVAVPYIVKTRGTETKISNCEFGMFSNNVRLQGIRNLGVTNFFGYFENPKLTLDTCTFYETAVDVVGDNVIFDSCTFKKNYSSTSFYWLSIGQGNVGTGNNRTFTGKPIIFNNCTFDALAATKDIPLFYCFDGFHAVFNGGSINTNPASNPFYFNNTTSKVKFNNVSTPSWGTAFPGVSGTIASWVNTENPGTVAFQRFNQVEGDHRLYSGFCTTFSDSTIFDSSPRSLRIYPHYPSGYFQVNENVTPIRIPLKKNQSATVTAKIKLSPPEATYTYTGAKLAYHGMIPSLVIKANPALGANYNSDQETFATASTFNGSTSTPGWSPTDLGTDLRLWLSSADLSDITYNATTKLVSQWNDKSGRGNHLSQSTDSKKPILKTSSTYLNSSCVSLTATKDQRLVSSGNILSGNTSNVTLFFVAAGTPSKNSNAHVPNFYSFNGTTSRMMGYFGGSFGNPDTYQFHTHALETNSARTNSSGSDATEGPFFNHLITIGAFKNNNGSSLRKPFTNNNPAGSVVTNASTVNITPNDFSLGVGRETLISATETTINVSASMDIFEFIVVDKQMTATEWADMHKFLGNKWNVSVKPDIGGSTSWQTVSWTIPAVTDDTVVEGYLNFRGANGALLSGYRGWVNIDSITVT